MPRATGALRRRPTASQWFEGSVRSSVANAEGGRITVRRSARLQSKDLSSGVDDVALEEPTKAKQDAGSRSRAKKLNAAAPQFKPPRGSKPAKAQKARTDSKAIKWGKPVKIPQPPMREPESPRYDPEPPMFEPGSLVFGPESPMLELPMFELESPQWIPKSPTPVPTSPFWSPALSDAKISASGSEGDWSDLMRNAHEINFPPALVAEKHDKIQDDSDPQSDASPTPTEHKLELGTIQPEIRQASGTGLKHTHHAPPMQRSAARGRSRTLNLAQKAVRGNPHRPRRRSGLPLMGNPSDVPSPQGRESSPWSHRNPPRTHGLHSPVHKGESKKSDGGPSQAQKRKHELESQGRNVRSPSLQDQSQGTIHVSGGGTPFYRPAELVGNAGIETMRRTNDELNKTKDGEPSVNGATQTNGRDPGEAQEGSSSASGGNRQQAEVNDPATEIHDWQATKEQMVFPSWAQLQQALANVDRARQQLSEMRNFIGQAERKWGSAEVQKKTKTIDECVLEIQESWKTLRMNHRAFRRPVVDYLKIWRGKKDWERDFYTHVNAQWVTRSGFDRKVIEVKVVQDKAVGRSQCKLEEGEIVKLGKYRVERRGQRLHFLWQPWKKDGKTVHIEATQGIPLQPDEERVHLEAHLDVRFLRNQG